MFIALRQAFNRQEREPTTDNLAGKKKWTACLRVNGGESGAVGAYRRVARWVFHVRFKILVTRDALEVRLHLGLGLAGKELVRRALVRFLIVGPGALPAVRRRWEALFCPVLVVMELLNLLHLLVEVVLRHARDPDRTSALLREHLP